jgi:hypothetical protein
VCVCVALVIQHAKHMRRIMSSVASPRPCVPHRNRRSEEELTSSAVPYCSTYLINGTIFGKNFFEHKMYFDVLYDFCLKYFSF